MKQKQSVLHIQYKVLDSKDEWGNPYKRLYPLDTAKHDAFLNGLDQGQFVDAFYDANKDDGTLALAKVHACIRQIAIDTGALDPGHLGDKPAALDHDILESSEVVSDCMGGEVHAVHAFFPAALLAATTTMGGMPMLTGITATEIVDVERQRIAALLNEVVASHRTASAHVRLEQGAATEVMPRVAESLGGRGAHRWARCRAAGCTRSSSAAPPSGCSTASAVTCWW